MHLKSFSAICYPGRVNRTVSGTLLSFCCYAWYTAANSLPEMDFRLPVDPEGKVSSVSVLCLSLPTRQTQCSLLASAVLCIPNGLFAFQPLKPMSPSLCPTLEGLIWTLALKCLPCPFLPELNSSTLKSCMRKQPYSDYIITVTMNVTALLKYCDTIIIKILQNKINENVTKPIN